MTGVYDVIINLICSLRCYFKGMIFRADSSWRAGLTDAFDADNEGAKMISHSKFITTMRKANDCLINKDHRQFNTCVHTTKLKYSGQYNIYNLYNHSFHFSLTGFDLQLDEE